MRENKDRESAEGRESDGRSEMAATKDARRELIDRMAKRMAEEYAETLRRLADM